MSESTAFLTQYLNYNKLSTPNLEPSLRRPRLVRQLAGLSRCRVALVRAEAGYGKTTAIASFLRDWPHSHTWYRLDKDDRDVTQFVTYLTEGISSCFPDFGTEIRERVATHGDTGQAAWLPRLLLHEISKLPPTPLLIVLDNFEAVIPSAGVCALVSDLLEYSGPDIHFAVASRVLPPLHMARLEARQQMLLLGPEDLALTVDESRELLLGSRESTLTDSQLDLLWRRTEGWPAGLGMIAAALRRRSPGDVIAGLESLEGSPGVLYQYFADEVFQHQNPDVQELLIKTSILKRLSRDVVNDFLGIDQGGNLLSTLQRGGAFAHIEGPEEDLRYHPLFHAFLSQKLRDTQGDEAIRQLHRRAAGAACHQQEWGAAIHHYTESNDWEEVADLIERLGDDLTRRGFLETVRHWLDLLPGGYVLRRPALLMLRGRLLRHGGRHSEALRNLEKALNGYLEGSDITGTVMTEVEIALAHYCLGEFRLAENVLGSALRRASDDQVLRSRVLAEMSGTCVAAGNAQEAEKWAEMAAAASTSAADDPSTTVSLVRALRFRGHALMLQGQVSDGIRSIRRSIELCRTEYLGDLDTSWSLLLLGQGLSQCGAFCESLQALGEAASLAHGSVQLVTSVDRWRATVYRDQGTFDLADEAFQRSGRNSALRELAFLRLRQGRVAEAARLSEEALRCSWTSENPSHTAACQVVRGIVMGAGQSREEALQLFAAAADTFRQLGRRQHLASLQWHLVSLLVAEGRTLEAGEQISEAVSWASAIGLYHLFWWDPRMAASVWPLAFEFSAERSYVMEFARLRFGPREALSLLRVLDSVPTALRSELLDTLEGIAGEGSGIRTVSADLLDNCHVPSIRHHIVEALVAGTVNLTDISSLRWEAGLTWKELEVLVLYYLANNNTDPLDGQVRRRLAESMDLSEQTLKSHIRSLRAKLDLSEGRRGSRLTMAALTQRVHTS